MFDAVFSRELEDLHQANTPGEMLREPKKGLCMPTPVSLPGLRSGGFRGEVAPDPSVFPSSRVGTQLKWDCREYA